MPRSKSGAPEPARATAREKARDAAQDEATAFAPTPIGWIAFGFGLALWIAGGVRNESASLLAGAGLVATTVICAIGVLVERRRLSRARDRVPAAFDLSITTSSDATGASATPAVAIDNPSAYRAVFPGVYARARLILRARSGRVATGSVVLPGKAGRARATIGSGGRPPARGVYRAETGLVEAVDVFGLCRAAFAVPGPFELTVPPALVEAEALPERSSGGERISPAPKLARSDEFYDSRKYVPGDDTRRLNWKQFGHFGELYMRVGEPVPPPRARVIVLLDTEAPKHGDARRNAEILDALAALARSCAEELAGSGREAVCLMPGFEPLSGGLEPREGSAEPGDYFADAAWDDGSTPVVLPPDPSPRVVCFAATGSARPERVRREVEARGGSMFVVERGTLVERLTVRDSLKRLFLRPTGAEALS